MLVASVGTVTALFVWCIYKVLTIPDETEHLHGFESPTPDLDSDWNREKPERGENRPGPSA